jgi:hypothetical protein
VERPFTHQINGNIDASTTSVVVDDGTNFGAGDLIEFSDGEQAHVLSVATNTLTVIRGYNGTTAASHSDDVVILKNPRFTIAQVNDAMDARTRQLWGQGIYDYATGSLTLVAGQDYYDLTDTLMKEVLSVYYAQDNTLIPVPLPFRYYDALDTNVSASTRGIHLLSWGEKAAGDTIYYTYKKQFTLVTDMNARTVEIVVLGATASLLASTMGPRTHDSSRYTDRTVQAGQGGRDARWYETAYLMEVRGEQARLKMQVKELPGTVQTKRARRWRP